MPASIRATPITSTSTAASRRRCRCRPSELGLALDRPFTVTGGMTFAGGPLDNYNFQALAKMVEVLRERPGHDRPLTCISGMITKHGMALWSTAPPADGFRFADVSDETSARTEVHDLAPDYDGPARIDGYTVVHSRAGEPERAIVVATTRDGRRTVAATHRHRPRRRDGQRRVVRARDPGPRQPFRGVIPLLKATGRVRRHGGWPRSSGGS